MFKRTPKLNYGALVELEPHWNPDVPKTTWNANTAQVLQVLLLSLPQDLHFEATPTQGSG